MKNRAVIITDLFRCPGLNTWEGGGWRGQDVGGRVSCMTGLAMQVGSATPVFKEVKGENFYKNKF
jgi:hypothetical protein